MLEWGVAAALFAAATALGSALLREVRTVRPIVPVIAGEAHLYYEAPAAIPAGAVSLPFLLLDNGDELRVGARASEVARRLTAISESAESGTFRQRVTRFYVDAGVRFAAVFEAPEAGAAPRVAAIYLP